MRGSRAGRTLVVVCGDPARRGRAVRRAARLPVPCNAGFAAPAGEPPYRRAGYIGPPVDAEGRMYWPRERAITQLYARLDRGSAERLADWLRPQPRGLFDKPYPLTKPPPIPSAFLYAREDELFDDHWSRWIWDDEFRAAGHDIALRSVIEPAFDALSQRPSIRA